jgi:hypothetical protein
LAGKPFYTSPRFFAYRIHTSQLRFALKRDSLSTSDESMEVVMAKVAYGLGRFGDRRLEKGGPGCTGRWWRGPARVFVALAVTGRARCSFAGFFTTGR